MQGHEDAQETAHALSVPEAARIVGVSPQALRKRLARAGAISRRAVAGRIVATVERSELERLYPALGKAERAQPPAAPAERPAQVAQPERAPAGEVSPGVAPLLREVERLQRELESERLARARVEGELAASAKVEAAAQRYADRAEAKLAEARREALSLARALGQVEQERDSSRAQLAGRRGFWARVTARN